MLQREAMAEVQVAPQCRLTNCSMSQKTQMQPDMHYDAAEGRLGVETYLQLPAELFDQTIAMQHYPCTYLHNRQQPCT